MYFTLLYPERRTVRQSVLEGWFRDAVANEEIPCLVGEQKDVLVPVMDNLDIHQKIELMEDAGIITVAKTVDSPDEARERAYYQNCMSDFYEYDYNDGYHGE